jgi:hypothetical protein
MKPTKHDKCSMDTLVLAFAGIWIVSVMVTLLM